MRRLAASPGAPGRRVDRQPLDHGALVLGQPEHGSSTAWCSTALARMRRRSRVLAAARPVEALDREVVRLGAAAGEHDLAGPGAERRGERLAGLLDDAAGRRRPDACSDDGLPTSPSCAVIASTASGSIGVVAA